jgi:predicted nucleic acid-binding protein
VRVVADTGGIVVALNSTEPEHSRFRAVLDEAAGVFITEAVVTEVHHVLSSAGQNRAAKSFLDAVADGFYELVPMTAPDHALAAELIRRYEGKTRRKKRRPGSLNLADAMNVVAAARLATNLLVATDQDYRLVAPLTAHPAFALLPYD